MSNANVNVTITPIAGTGITQLGMFDISITPVNPTDQILALQYVVSVADQPPGDFVAFVFIGNLPAGTGLPSSIFYASCDAVNANQSGQALTVQVVGGLNDPHPFDVSQTFSQNLWPGGTCLTKSSGRKRLSEEAATYSK